MLGGSYTLKVVVCLLAILVPLREAGATAGRTEIKSPACAVFKGGAYGLTSNLNNLVQGIFLTAPSQYYFDDSNFHYKCPEGSIFDVYFNSSLPLKGPSPPGCHKIDYKFTHAGMAEMSPDAAFHAMGEVLRNVWRLSEPQAALSAQHIHYLRSMASPLIAVHVRAGDKHLENLQFGLREAITGDYAAVLQASFGHLDKASCLVVTDSLDIVASIAQAVSSVLQCQVFIQAPPQYSNGYDLMVHSLLKDRVTCDIARTVIQDVDVMAQADYFIGDFNSNVSRLVHLLRHWVYGKNVSTSMDALLRAWHPQPWNATEYKLRHLLKP